MSPHVDHQHVLCLKGLLLSRAFLPPAHKLLLLPMDVVIVDVLEKKMKEFKLVQFTIISDLLITLREFLLSSKGQI